MKEPAQFTRTTERIFKPGIRLSDLPRPKWWGKTIKFFKTLEVIIFKILESFDLYRPSKSIVGIPTLAMRHSTSLQAVVYNGTQEEVLGFKARRLLHRLIPGIPDLESFERIRFQVATSENQFRSIEASTENRGFVHLQVPWELQKSTPKTSWLRIQPVGVETLLGCIRLGNYEVLSAPVFFLNSNIKWIIVSDIDDTIKDSKIGETTGFRAILRGLFKGHYYKYEAIDGMAELYQKLIAQNCLIVYVTSTPYQLSPFLLKFLRERGFPEGPVFMRWLGYGRFGHKWRTLHRIFSQLEGQRVILIGDSGEQDLQIYRRVSESAPSKESVAKILIRHIAGTALPTSPKPNEIFYKDIPSLLICPSQSS